MSKNLVMGAIFGYNVEKIKPFIISLRRYYNDDIVLITDKVDSDLEKFCEEHTVYTYIPENPYNRIVHVARYGFYLDCLENFDDVENILLADARDVIFQSNPFEKYPEKSIEFFAEPELFKNCTQHNGPWYSGLYGQEELEKIKDEYIICSGTTMGKRDEIIKYINALLVEVERLESINRPPGFCDQAVHNRLIYTGVFNDFRINQNGKGLISTMHHSKVLSFNRRGQLLNDDGTPTPVVHQYDRCGPMSMVFIKNALGGKGWSGIKESANYVVNNFHEHDMD